MKLQIEAISVDCNSDDDIEEVLRILPTTLAETYSRCLLRIPKRRPGDLHLAPKILRWVAFANRSSHISELKEAIAFGPGDATWKNGKVPKNISGCGNLLVFDDDGTVRLAHNTVRQFLLSRKKPDSKAIGMTLDEQTKILEKFDFRLEQAEADIGEDCVTYLSFSDFDARLIRTAETSDRKAHNIPPPIASFHASANPILYRLTKRAFPRSSQLRKTVDLPQMTTVHPEASNYELLEYAKTYWALHTAHITDKSPVWDKFRRLALTQNRSWKLQPWIKGESRDETYYKSLFQWAIDYEHIPLLSLLDSLPRGTKLSDLSKLLLLNGHLPLTFAATNNRVRAVEFLLSYCKVNAKNEIGETALHGAAGHGRKAAVNALLAAKGIKVNARSNRNATPLLLAAYGDHMEVAQLLLEKGADVEAKDRDGKTVLHGAAMNGNWEFLQLLLDAKALFEGYFERENDTLLRAASEGDWEAVVLLLLKRRPDIDIQKGDTCCALQEALYHGHEMVVRLLLTIRLGVSMQDKFWVSALGRASYQGYDSIIQLLLEKGADINAQCEDYGTPLHAASHKGCDSIVQLLLEKGADVNAQGGLYGNALHAASRQGHKGVVRLLLEMGPEI